MSLEENGHASILRDLLKIEKTFTFRRYWVDTAGFFVAWTFVIIFISFYCWMATWK
jgi:hypothetical protein